MGRDVAAKVTSDPLKGTNSDITATDQIRPVATTMVIATLNARICCPFMPRWLMIGLA